MLTAADFYKIQKDTNHIPASKRNKPKVVNTNVSKLAMESVLSVINSYNGFVSNRTLEFKTGYASSTIKRVTSLLRAQDIVDERIDTRGRVQTIYVRAKKETLK